MTETNYAGVQFLDDPSVKKIVHSRLIRLDETGAAFVPECIQDVPLDPVDVKWQKSDLGSDGFFPAKILFWAGSADSALAEAKARGLRLTRDCVMEAPFKTALASSPAADKASRRRITKRASDETLETSDQKQKKSSKDVKKSKTSTKSASASKLKGNKKPTNRLVTDPNTAARLKESMAAAMNSNPILFKHLDEDDNLKPKAELENQETLKIKIEPNQEVTVKPSLKTSTGTESKKGLSSDAHTHGEEVPPSQSSGPESFHYDNNQIFNTNDSGSDHDSDDLNTTVEANQDADGTSSSSGSETDKIASGSSSGDEDPVSKLIDSKVKRDHELQKVKEENRSLKSQLAVVWGEHKDSTAGLEAQIQSLKDKAAGFEAQIQSLKDKLQKERDRNSCLQDSLLAASKAKSVSRNLGFGSSPLGKGSTLSPRKKGTPSPLKNPMSSPWKVTSEDSPKTEDSDAKPKSHAGSSEKKKSGKKYIEHNADGINLYCRKVLGFLNKTEEPSVNKDGDVDLGNGIFINYKKMIETLKADRGSPESLARNLALLMWGTTAMAERSLDGKTSNRYRDAPAKIPATPAKVNSVLGAVKAALLKSGNVDGPAVTTTLVTCRKQIGNKFNETSTKLKKS